MPPTPMAVAPATLIDALATVLFYPASRDPHNRPASFGE
jgi:hypothetical protein